MINKNIIVTGANCGIGYETALELAKRGARVIIACRDETKANQACDKIKQESKNDKVEVELLDLSKLKSIKAFSERIIAKLDRLDVLINNAGTKIIKKFYSIHFSSILIFEKD
jgi:NAD(P)-dependent dehydrogenase (short-subunit alcohol dehydrogenase family)